jgi:hypothetical protein
LLHARCGGEKQDRTEGNTAKEKKKTGIERERTEEDMMEQNKTKGVNNKNRDRNTSGKED